MLQYLKIPNNAFEISIFSACGYSNRVSFKKINDEDVNYVENFIRHDLLERISAKCNRLKIPLDKNIKSQFFGTFSHNEKQFKFTEEERSLILSFPEKFNNIDAFDETLKNKISLKSKRVGHWFDDLTETSCESKIQTPDAPTDSQNLLCEMLNAAKINSARPKQGYRYKDKLKHLTVYNRILSGPMGYKSLQLNLKGCFPSISTTNRYIHRSDHHIVEGVLRCQELLNFLIERKLPLFVSLSEDATKIENRIQYDSQTVQLVGFILPINESNGMPIPFSYKGRTAGEILMHFSTNRRIASNVNTVIAQPLGEAPSFCLLLFGTDNRYKSLDVSKRWTYIAEELTKIGITVLSISSDSDTKFNAAMRKNTCLGNSSNEFSMNGIFMCGTKFEPPFYLQDFPHIGTKLRNLFLQTIANVYKLPMGNFYIQQNHLKQLMDICTKDQHHLTATDLNPADRQNFDSVLKICDIRVINLLKEKVMITFY